ncbi:VRR-NUC domain-containing protein [Brevibacterium sp. XM4083]|uniref:VRR-NUC domain-containing protein n=1 Tax=Brevibacterium sp. XM4083 TaxID=2583238 RepID=UPI0020300823|nr:VRR-NUC domain-containing protein [Brevibacterium sp. XM4083]
MKLDDYRALRAKGMTERQLQDQIVELAKRMGWLVYHTYDSRRSEPGFPDLVLVHPKQMRQLWRELKSETGETTSAQKVWLSALLLVGDDVDIWRPRDWVSGRIERELRGQ